MKTLYIMLLVLLVTPLPPPNTDSVMPPPEFRLEFIQQNRRYMLLDQLWQPPQFHHFINRSIMHMMMEEFDLQQTIRSKEKW